MHFFGLQNLDHYSLPLLSLKEPGRFIIELRLYSSERRKSYTRWINHEVIFIFWWTIPLSNSTFFRICLKKHLKGICESRLWSLLAKQFLSPSICIIRAGFRSGGLGVGVYSSMGTISWRGSDVETREHDGRNSARRPPQTPPHRLPLPNILRV